MEIVAESWRQVPGFVGYEASDCGRVRSVDRLIIDKLGRKVPHKGRVLRPCTSRKGYLVVGTGYKKRSVYVHSMVALAFIGDRPDGFEVNHKDAVKTNNKPENLEYITGLDNIRHANKLGLVRPMKGERNGRSKLTCAMVAEIRFKRESGVVLRLLAEEYGVVLQVIHDIVKRKTWKHVA